MRYILTILLITVLTNLNAQAPDFTLTDINGISHNLYTYLGEGKTVVIHFAATDCVECWDFHDTQNMNLANVAYGTAGTDEMVFLLLETNADTGEDALQGNGLYTHGNWISGTSYPIIDDAGGTAADYGITDLPTIIAICPTDTISTDLYTAGYPTPAEMYITHNICTPATTTNDLTIIDIPTESFCGTLNPELLLLNTGSDTITDITFEISTDTQSEMITWNGNMAPNEPTTLTLGTTITEGTTIEVTALDVNATPDGSSFTKTVIQAQTNCVEELVITIVTDGFGCETGWNLTGPVGTLGGNGNVNATAGNRAIEYDAETGACGEAGYDNNTLYIVSFPGSTLEGQARFITTGCHEFHIVDDWGDGMCCDYGDGSYTIADQDGNVLATGGDFGAEDIVQLDIKLAISPGTVTSSGVDTICKDATYVLENNDDAVLDSIRGFINIAWGAWIIKDPLDATTIPIGGLPNDHIPTDDVNYAGYWSDADGQAILGDSIQISADSSGITYYIAPIVTNAAGEFDTTCGGLNPSEGYTVIMNPLDDCEPFIVVDVEQPISTTNITVSPNPAQDYFNISFDLNRANDVEIRLYNAVGQEVKYLTNTMYTAGENNITMNTNGLPSGIYFVSLQTQAGNLTKRVTISKP